MSARHIAVLQRPDSGAPYFTFPVEHGDGDSRSNYWHGQKYGNGGFTGERCLVHRDGPYRGRPVFFRQQDHEARLQETLGAHEYLEFGCSMEQRIEARQVLMAMNRGDNYLSLVFGSEGDVGVYPKLHQPAVLINSRDMDPSTKPYLPLEAMRRGLAVRISEPDLRHKPPGRIARAKASANYLESNLCKHRALQAGFDDGLLLDHTGDRIAEGSVSNLVLLVDGALLTPWADSAPLPGITLRTVGQLAQDLPELTKRKRRRMTLSEAAIPPNVLSRIRGAFLTGTAVGIVKIRTIVHYDGRVLWDLHDDEASRLIDDLNCAYWKLLYGQFPGYHSEWFTPIPSEITERYDRQQSFIADLST